MDVETVDARMIYARLRKSLEARIGDRVRRSLHHYRRRRRVQGKLGRATQR
jgi:hypothetical protein